MTFHKSRVATNTHTTGQKWEPTNGGNNNMEKRQDKKKRKKRTEYDLWRLLRVTFSFDIVIFLDLDSSNHSKFRIFYSFPLIISCWYLYNKLYNILITVSYIEKCIALISGSGSTTGTNIVYSRIFGIRIEYPIAHRQFAKFQNQIRKFKILIFEFANWILMRKYAIWCLWVNSYWKASSKLAIFQFKIWKTNSIQSINWKLSWKQCRSRILE